MGGKLFKFLFLYVALLRPYLIRYARKNFERHGLKVETIDYQGKVFLAGYRHKFSYFYGVVRDHFFEQTLISKYRISYPDSIYTAEKGFCSYSYLNIVQLFDDYWLEV